MTLTAGRELDALIAEKVMGWKWRVWNLNAYTDAAIEVPGNAIEEAQKGYRFLNPPNEDEWAYLPAEGKEPVLDKYYFRPPGYSTSIAAAEEQVIPKMRENGWIVIIYYCLDGSVEVYLDRREFRRDEDRLVAFGDTAPLAICLAALKANDANPRQ